MNYSQVVKNCLVQNIHEMAQCKSLYVRNPERDFIRERKLGFEKMLQFFITMGSQSMQKELFDFFDFDADTATVSAFTQQRAKILPEALEHLFHRFNASFPERKTYQGYRLIACDGSRLNVPYDPQNEETYFHRGKKGNNQMHLTALYDLCNRRYEDVVIHLGRHNNECKAFVDMVDRYPSTKKTIFLADRFYESYNLFAHVAEKGLHYLIRVKDLNSNCMLSRMQLPATEEFDLNIHLIQTRNKTLERADPNLYRFICKKRNFDFGDGENLHYPMDLRVVRFAVAADTYECIITNLSKEEFSSEQVKKLYQMRWGIEISFRELKYTIGLASFHSKKVESIKQEIFARLLLYNFCEIITTHVVIAQKERTYTYQVNYTVAIHICRYFLKCPADIPPPDVEHIIQKKLLPVRPERNFQRIVRAQRSVSFLYRYE